MDFYSFFNIGCLVNVTYLDSALIQIIFPTVLILLAFVAKVVFDKKGDKKKAGLCVQFIVVFTFLVFVATSNKVGAASLPSILGCACPDAPTVSCALWFVLPVLASDLLHA